MSIIGIYVKGDVDVFKDVANRRSVERENERTNGRALRDTSSNVERWRGGRLNNNMLSAIRKIGSK